MPLAEFRTTRQVVLTAQGSELLAVTRPALNEELANINRDDSLVCCPCAPTGNQGFYASGNCAQIPAHEEGMSRIEQAVKKRQLVRMIVVPIARGLRLVNAPI